VIYNSYAGVSPSYQSKHTRKE